MTAVERPCAFEEVACSKMTLRDRLRALQESATKWERRCSAGAATAIELPERLNFHERQKAFGNVSNPPPRPSFHAPKPSGNHVSGIISANDTTSTQSAARSPRSDQSATSPKSREITVGPASGVNLEFVNKKLRVAAEKPAEEEPPKAASREERIQSPLKRKQSVEAEDTKMEESSSPSYMLPNPKRNVPKPARRMPSKYTNLAAAQAPTLTIDPSALQVDAENKENECLARSPQSEPAPKRPNIASAVPFQLPQIGKEHCGVQLRHVDKKAPFPDPMLVQARTAGKHVDLRLVQPTASSVHDRAAFLLITAKKMIVFNGAKANVNERSKIAQFAHEVIAGKQIHAYSGKPEHANEDGTAEAAFFRLLGAESVDERKHEGPSDEEFEEKQRASFRFYRIEATGEPQPIETTAISWSALDSDQVVVVDFGSEIYLWFGRNSNRSLSKQATAFVDQLKASPLLSEMQAVVGVKESGEKRPFWILTRRLAEGIADQLFEQKFPGGSPIKKPLFAKPLQSTAARPQVPVPSAFHLRRSFVPKPTAQPKDEEAIASSLAARLAKIRPPEEDCLELEGVDIRPNDPSVFTEGLRFLVLNGDELKPLDEQPTEFNTHKCYVVHWDYRLERPGVGRLKDRPAKQEHHETGRERSVFFYWLGAQTSVLQKSRCALALRNADKKRLKHVRMEEGSEHPVFIGLFPDGFIVADEGVHSFLFRSYNKAGNLLAAVETSATHAKEMTASMRIAEGELLLERGRFCPPAVWANAQRVAERFAAVRGLQLTGRSEGEAGGEVANPRFFRIFGLDGEEMSPKRSGVHRFPVQQADLSDCVLVEHGDRLWVWAERTAPFALKVARMFWSAHRKGDEQKALVIAADHEPAEFKALFAEWKEPAEEDRKPAFTPTLLMNALAGRTAE